MLFNRNALIPTLSPALYRVGAEELSTEIDARGWDRAYFLASGDHGASIAISIWGKCRASVPTDVPPSTAPPVTIPVDGLTEVEGEAWFILDSLTLPITNAGPAAPDVETEFASALKKVDVQACESIKIKATSVTGTVTLWVGGALGIHVGVNG